MADFSKGVSKNLMRKTLKMVETFKDEHFR